MVRLRSPRQQLQNVQEAEDVTKVRDPPSSPGRWNRARCRIRLLNFNSPNHTNFLRGLRNATVHHDQYPCIAEKKRLVHPLQGSRRAKPHIWMDIKRVGQCGPPYPPYRGTHLLNWHTTASQVTAGQTTCTQVTVFHRSQSIPKSRTSRCHEINPGARARVMENIHARHTLSRIKSLKRGRPGALTFFSSSLMSALPTGGGADCHRSRLLLFLTRSGAFPSRS